MDFSALISSPFFVGAAGAVVSLRFVDGKGVWKTIRKVIGTPVCGAFIGGYCAQPLADWLHLTKTSDTLGVAFVLGLLGLSIFSAVLRAIGELKVAEIISGWISRRG